MGKELEAPRDAAELYLARLPDVPPGRPLLTGDVLEGVEVPGEDEVFEQVLLVEHPCSMRVGASLAERVLVAPVCPYQELEPRHWPRGHYRVMPLPALLPNGSFRAGAFDRMGRVKGEVLQQRLQQGRRVACLSQLGINLLQQRMVFHLSRVVVPTSDFDRAFAHVLEEADLMEEWLLRRLNVVLYSSRRKRASTSSSVSPTPPVSAAKNSLRSHSGGQASAERCGQCCASSLRATPSRQQAQADPRPEASPEARSEERDELRDFLAWV